VRDASEEELEFGGPLNAEPDIEDIVGSDKNVKPIN